MNENKSDSDILRWVNMADERLRTLISLMKPVASFAGFSDEQRRTVGWLSSASLRASGSSLLLVEHERIWDAEILSRTVFEGTLKFCHLLSEPSMFANRCGEFETVLPDISALADHEKAQRLIAALPIKDASYLKPFEELLIKEEERQQLFIRYPKHERRRLQTAWGFTGLIEHMIRSGEGLGEQSAGFLHGYAMSSHVAHADFLGVGMVMEREYRDEERRNAAHLAHAGRVISDQLWFCALRLIVSYRFIGEDITPISELMNDGSEFWQELSEVQRTWYRIEYGIELNNDGAPA